MPPKSTQPKMTPKKTSEASSGKWVDDLVGLIGQYVKIETLDGCLREGRLSGLGWALFHVNGGEVRRPTDFELNGDPNDKITLERVKKISLL